MLKYIVLTGCLFVASNVLAFECLSTKDINEARDGYFVELCGVVAEKISEHYFIIKDKSGKAIVEIPEDVLPFDGNIINREVEIYGVIDSTSPEHVKFKSSLRANEIVVKF